MAAWPAAPSPVVPRTIARTDSLAPGPVAPRLLITTAPRTAAAGPLAVARVHSGSATGELGRPAAAPPVAAVAAVAVSPTVRTTTPAGGQIVAELYEHFGEATTTTPAFYFDFPSSTSPLTRPHRTIDGVSERWDLVAWGVELGTAYTELTDPLEQRRRLTEQSILAAGGDPEAMELDEDFLQALEYAMPPTGGLGLGVDRIVMLITGRSIRESLPFPLTKPQQP